VSFKDIPWWVWAWFLVLVSVLEVPLVYKIYKADEIEYGNIRIYRSLEAQALKLERAAERLKKIKQELKKVRAETATAVEPPPVTTMTPITVATETCVPHDQSQDDDIVIPLGDIKKVRMHIQQQQHVQEQQQLQKPF
jgi:hypothetical protein